MSSKIGRVHFIHGIYMVPACDPKKGHLGVTDDIRKVTCFRCLKCALKLARLDYKRYTEMARQSSFDIVYITSMLSDSTRPAEQLHLFGAPRG